MKVNLSQQSSAIEVARRYVNDQLQIMKKNGSAPKLSGKAYDSLVKKVAKAASR